MLIKINLKRYFIPSSITMLLTFLLIRSLKEMLIVIIIYAATIISHLVLVKVVQDYTNLINSETTAKTINILKIIFLFMAKFILLLGAMFLGVHFMGKRAIIPLVNYIVHIFILGFALKK